MSGTRSIHPDDEDRIVRDMTDELEALKAGSVVSPGDGFTERVMTSIAAEPLPQPVRAFRLALVAGRLRAAASAVGDAWRVAMSGFAPVAVRAQALALVLAVSLGTVVVAGGATVGAINLLTPPQPPTIPRPSPVPSVTPSPSPSPSLAPTDQASPSDGAQPTNSAEPTDTPEPTGTDDRGGRTASPTATQTEDHGGSGGGGSGGGGSGRDGSETSGGGHETPKPTESDGHSGSDG